MRTHYSHHPGAIEVREAWLIVYAYDGTLAAERYLALHAAFNDYLSMRNDPARFDGDRDAHS